MTTRTLVATAVLAFSVLPNPSKACTAFALNHTEGNGVMFSKSYDWYRTFDHLYAVVNPRGLEKTSMNYFDTDLETTWTSKYGSLTFNQFGREFPNGGMNEKGLAIEALVLSNTEHVEETDPRASLNEAQWIQYFLDQYETVEDMISHVEDVRISKAYIGLHYMACDVTGLCAVFEYIDGELQIYRTDDLSVGLGVALITNDTVERSHEFFEDMSSRPEDDRYRERRLDGGGSLARYGRTAFEIEDYLPLARNEAVDHAFWVLEEVSQMDRTLQASLWNQVYDTENLEVFFRSRKHLDRKRIRFSELDFSCKDEFVAINLGEHEEAGDVEHLFETYTDEMNDDLADKNWPLISRKKIGKVSDYARSVKCAETENDAE